MLSKVRVRIAVIGGVVAAVAGAAPTGGRWTDALLVVVGLSVVCWVAGHAAPTLVIVVAGGLGAWSLGSWPIAVACLATGAFVTAVELRSANAVWPPVAGAAILCVCASILPAQSSPLWSIIVGCAAVTILCIGGLRTLPRTQRRWVGYGVIWVAEAALILSGIALYRIVRERDAIEALRSTFDQAVTAASHNDLDQARLLLDTSKVQARALSEAFDGPDVRLGEFVPVVAQNLRAVRQVAEGSIDVIDQASAAVEVVRPERLTITDGRVELDAIESMASSSDRVERSLDGLARTLVDLRSPVLIGRLRTPLIKLERSVFKAQKSAGRAAAVLDVAPGVLGVDHPHHYFVGFTTPAEARPLSGFIGNFAELTVTDGRIKLSRFGRSGDLIDRTGLAGPLVLDGPSDYLARYVGYGVGSPGTPTPSAWWQQVTISPDLPSVSKVITQLYHHAFGTELDGVVIVDPVGVSALMTATGPVPLDEVGAQVDAGNVAAYLGRDQYLALASTSNDARVDALEHVARTTLERLLDLGAVPRSTMDSLWSSVAGGHIGFWAADPAEEAALTLNELDGSFDLAGPKGARASDAIAVVHANGGPNKLDAFLQRTVGYDATLDPSTGSLRATTTIELTNSVPSLDLPPVVIGNATGDPSGTNRMVLTVYSKAPIVSATLDGVAATPSSEGIELGWHYLEQVVAIAPGATATIVVRTEATVDPDAPFSLYFRPQPSLDPTPLTVTVHDPSGRPIWSTASPIDRPTVLQPAG